MHKRKDRWRQGKDGVWDGMVVMHDTTEWTQADHKALVEYIDAHDWLDDRLHVLGDSEIEQLAQDLETPGASLEVKKRALVRLAHACSPKASRALQLYLERVDEQLRRFAWFAFEEALQWLSAGPDVVDREKPFGRPPREEDGLLRLQREAEAALKH